MVINSPCYGCSDRCVEPNCHTTCGRYLDYEKAKSDYYGKVAENKKSVKLQRDYICEKRRYRK